MLQCFNVQLKHTFDLESILVVQGPNESIIRLVEIVFGVIINSEERDQQIQKILELDEETQFNLQRIVEKGMRLSSGVEDEEEEEEVLEEAKNQTPEHHRQLKEEESFKHQPTRLGPESGEKVRPKSQKVSTPEKSFDVLELEIQIQRKDEKIEELYQSM